MRFLPLGFYLVSCGCFILGMSLGAAGRADAFSIALPFIGGVLALAGYLVCRPALKLAKAAVALEKQVKR